MIESEIINNQVTMAGSSVAMSIESSNLSELVCCNCTFIAAINNNTYGTSQGFASCLFCYFF